MSKYIEITYFDQSSLNKECTMMQSHKHDQAIDVMILSIVKYTEADSDQWNGIINGIKGFIKDENKKIKNSMTTKNESLTRKMEEMMQENKEEMQKKLQSSQAAAALQNRKVEENVN